MSRHHHHRHRHHRHRPAATPSTVTMSRARTITPFTPGSVMSSSANTTVGVSTTTGGLRSAGATKATPHAVATSSPSPYNQDGESSESCRPPRGSTGRRQFSQATVLALGSLVLARRLARARGPCLPVRVQEIMGLGCDDALDLLTEGVRLARRAFQTQVETRHPVNEAEGEGLSRGIDIRKSILASEVVFDREVVSSGKTRTLLEWVTDGENETHERAAADEIADRLGKAMTARKDLSPPEFLQGVALSSTAVGVSTTAVSSSRMPAPARNHPAVSSSLAYSLSSDSGGGGGGGGGGGDSLSYSDSDTSSDGRMRGNPLLTGSSGVALAPGHRPTSPSICTRSNDVKGSDSFTSEYMTASEQTLCSSCSSSSPPVVTTNNDVETAPPPLRAHQEDDGDDTTESDSTPPSSSSLSPPSSSSSSSSSSSRRTARARGPVGPGASAVTVASNTRGDAAFSGGRSPGKRVAPERAGGGRLSRKGVSTVRKRPRITTGKTSSRTRSLPLSAAASSPAQRENARWEVLIDRVLAALGDGCGCSFCKLRDNGGGGGSAVGGGAFKHPPSPPPISPQDWWW
ncbi:unnamed protein product [Pylaiella littoralis]